MTSKKKQKNRTGCIARLFLYGTAGIWLFYVFIFYLGSTGQFVSTIPKGLNQPSYSWEFFKRASYPFNPFNTWAFLSMVVSFLPPIGLILLARVLKKSQNVKRNFFINFFIFYSLVNAFAKLFFDYASTQQLIAEKSWLDRKFNEYLFTTGLDLAFMSFLIVV